MRKTMCGLKAPLFLGAFILAGLLLDPGMLPAQEEVMSSIRRYKQYEESTGFYEEHEVRPRRGAANIDIPGVRRGLFPYSPTAATVRIRARLADSHMGIKFYERRQCKDCHMTETHDIHTTRANLTCRQCHGLEPIASLDHYYSPMNPIRRHASICAKCHEGASASFSSYIVHEPAAGSIAARASFPALYYTYWFMFALLAGTLAFFIPHSLLIGLRELIGKKWKAENDEHDTD